MPRSFDPAAEKYKERLIFVMSESTEILEIPD